MEDKRKNLRTLAVACAAALLAVAVLLLLFLSGQRGQRHEQIVLPETRPEQDQDQEPPLKETEEETVLSVTAENVQSVLKSMSRAQSYHQTFTVTRRSGTHTRTAVVDVWVSDGTIRAESSDGFETRSILTDGATIYLWYEGETPVALSMQENASYEDLAGLPTYEDIVRFPVSAIQEGGFLANAQQGVDLIYVRALTDSGERQYWVSTETGLLYRQATTVQGTVVYEAEQTFFETISGEDASQTEIFRLPDGSVPF